MALTEKLTMKALWKLLPALALVSAAACADNPILEPDIHA